MEEREVVKCGTCRHQRLWDCQPPCNGCRRLEKGPNVAWQPKEGGKSEGWVKEEERSCNNCKYGGVSNYEWPCKSSDGVLCNCKGRPRWEPGEELVAKERAKAAQEDRACIDCIHVDMETNVPPCAAYFETDALTCPNWRSEERRKGERRQAYRRTKTHWDWSLYHTERRKCIGRRHGLKLERRHQVQTEPPSVLTAEQRLVQVEAERDWGSKVLKDVAKQRDVAIEQRGITEKSRNALYGEIDALKRNIAALENTRKQAEKAWQDKCDGLALKLNAAERKRDEARREASQRWASQVQKQEALERAERERDQWKQQYDGMCQQREEWRRRAKEAEASVRKLTGVRLGETTPVDWQEKCAELAEDLTEARDKAKRLEAALDEERRQRQSYQLQLSAFERRADTLKVCGIPRFYNSAELERCKAQLDACIKERNDALRRNTFLNLEKAESAARERGDTSRELQACKAQLAEARAALATLKKL